MKTPIASAKIGKGFFASLGVLAMAATLSACSFNLSFGGEPKETPEKFATEVANALAAELNLPTPAIDCSAYEVIDIVLNSAYVCELTDPTSGAVFDVTTTITSVEGQDYKFYAQVAQTPKR